MTREFSVIVEAFGRVSTRRVRAASYAHAREKALAEVGFSIKVEEVVRAAKLPPVRLVPREDYPEPRAF